MPVLNEKSEYIGYYELLDIIGLFNQTPFLNEPGGILLIEKGLKDYSFSEISQIVESNNGKLLGAFISEMNENQVQITLKVGNAPLIPSSSHLDDSTTILLSTKKMTPI